LIYEFFRISTFYKGEYPLALKPYKKVLFNTENKLTIRITNENKIFILEIN